MRTLNEIIEDEEKTFDVAFANAGGDYDGSTEPLKSRLEVSMRRLAAEIQEGCMEVVPSFTEDEIDYAKIGKLDGRIAGVDQTRQELKSFFTAFREGKK